MSLTGVQLSQGMHLTAVQILALMAKLTQTVPRGPPHLGPKKGVSGPGARVGCDGRDAETGPKVALFYHPFTDTEAYAVKF